MPPFMPALAELEPLPLIQPSARSTCRRFARIDLPAPGPPHLRTRFHLRARRRQRDHDRTGGAYIRKKKLTS